MFLSESTNIYALAVHGVGNKSLDEGVDISKALVNINGSLNDLLLSFFLNPFKGIGFYNFCHENDLNSNKIYHWISTIFNDPETLYNLSVEITNHLYNCSVHPKVKWGEFYVVYFQDCIVEGNTVDGIGIFKSENREVYLNVSPANDNYTIQANEGIPIGKLDKGCIVFNYMPENGFLVALTENVKRSTELQYWRDDFLQVSQRNDSYFQTSNVIELCKGFASECMPAEFDVSKVDTADLLNKSASFLTNNESFTIDEFAKEVIQQPEVIESFKNYKSNFEAEHDIQINDQFELSPDALKKQMRVFKSVIKLDKNFHIYVHGNRENIARGFDDQSGLHFYQLFYKEEK